MKVLLKSARIVGSEGKFENKRVDILIEKGVITKVAASISEPKGARVIKSKNLHVSPGWFDMKVNFRDPGDEVKEDLHSGARAAAAGGFTGVLLMPSTNPPIQSKSEVEYVLKKSASTPVDIFPAGALSVHIKGEDITEMFDMKKAGAIAFTDDRKAVKDSGLMLRAMQYCQNIGSTLISYANDPGITGNNSVNEGIHSTIAGFKGTPALAEEIFTDRDIRICKYAEGKIHFATVTTASAIRLIKDAKKAGVKVSCEVTAHHIFFDDSMIAGYDTNYKVKPPLRSKEDVAALRKAVNEGIIDVICSDHSPQDIESKDTEFDFASSGIIGLETSFAAANTVLDGNENVGMMVDLFARNPRKILGLDMPQIKTGESANLTIFDPSHKWTFTDEDIISRSYNTPFVGTEFTGVVIGIINKGQLVLRESLIHEVVN